MTEEDKMKRAESAIYILASEAFRSAMDELETEQIETLLATDPCEVGEREHAYHMARALRELRAKIQSYADEKSADKRREESRTLHS